MLSRCLQLCSRRVGRSGGFTSHGPNSDAGPGTQVSTADVRRKTGQFLSDPNRHSDPWDIVKYVQLARGMFASFGGEARESYERFGNQDFGLSVPSPNGYLLQRYLLHADIYVGSRLRLWTELNSSFENGRVGGRNRSSMKTSWICIRGLWSSRSFNDLR